MERRQTVGLASRRARGVVVGQNTWNRSDSTIIASTNKGSDGVDVQDDDGLNTRNGIERAGWCGVADSRRSPNFLLFGNAD